MENENSNQSNATTISLEAECYHCRMKGAGQFEQSGTRVRCKDCGAVYDAKIDLQPVKIEDFKEIARLSCCLWIVVVDDSAVQVQGLQLNVFHRYDEKLGANFNGFEGCVNASAVCAECPQRALASNFISLTEGLVVFKAGALAE